jgi:outer membrane protein assembly factor BamB
VFVRDLVVDANDDVVILERDTVLSLKSSARTASIRWRHGAGKRTTFDRVLAFPAGDVLAVANRRPRSHVDGVFVERLTSRQGKRSWQWVLDPQKARQEITLTIVVIDAAGDVVVAPRIADGDAGRYDSEFAVIKLAGQSGEERWRASVAGLFHATGIATDADGNVVATANRESSRPPTSVVKLDGSTGRVTWRADLPDTWDFVRVRVGGDGVFVSFVDFPTTPSGEVRGGIAKLSPVDGTVAWIAVPDPAATTFVAIAEREGDVFAAGYEVGSAVGTSIYPPRSFVVTAFDGATGTQRWTYRSAAGDEGAATTLTFDAGGHVVAAGSVWNAQTCGDAFVVGLDAASGLPVWSRTIDGTFSTTDCHADVCDEETCPRVDDDYVYGLATDREGRITILSELVTKGAGRRPRDRNLIEQLTP